LGDIAFYVSYSKAVVEDDDVLEDHGWAGPRGWRWSDDPANAEAWSLPELKNEFFASAWSCGDASRGLYSMTETDPYTMETETLYLARPDGITDASWSRVVRLLGGRV